MVFAVNRKRSGIFLVAKITLVWMIIGVLISLYDYLTTSNDLFFIRTENFNYSLYLIINLVGAFIGGLSGGSFLVFYSMRKLRRQSFPVYVIVNTALILIIVAVLDFLVGSLLWFLFSNKLDLDKDSVGFALEGLFNILTIRSIGIWSVVILGTTFFLRISEGFGPGVVSDILRGRYHRPKVEERIFMFLDIKSSTAMAEQLGHKMYFELLSDFFADITDAIIYNEGDIYQYVGDEVVVSWRVKKGIENNNCINCFFDAKKLIDHESEKYMGRYGLIPKFKAGVHTGMATVGEIGVLKKIIAFSGDVLNTTARIQGNCNMFNKEMIISQDLFEKLQMKESWTFQELGEIELRGRKQRTKLYSVEEGDQ